MYTVHMPYWKIDRLIYCKKGKRKRKVNGYSKGIGLGNIYKNFLWKKKKKIILTTFYISHKSGTKTFLNWSINKCSKHTC